MRNSGIVEHEKEEDEDADVYSKLLDVDTKDTNDDNAVLCRRALFDSKV